MGGIITDQSIFKAYDIRGTYPEQINGNVAYGIGQTFCRLVGNGSRVCIARDVRLSGPELRENLLAGLSGSSLEISEIGVVPTPVIYFALVKYGFDGGIMITASHNPPEWNGFKIYGKSGAPIGMGSGLEKMRDTVFKLAPVAKLEPAATKDISQKVLRAYLGSLLNNSSMKCDLSVGIDPGNGSYSKIAAKAFRKKGIEVHAINNTPDGSFPSRPPEPKPEALSALKDLVIEKGLDFGIAFDADGDRGIFVDGKGQVLRGDVAFAVFAMQMLKKGDKAVFEVSCTDAVREAILANGGVPVMVPVGRTNMLAAMSGEKARIGGEISGHTYFSETFGGDDALFSGLKMADLISESGESLTKLLSRINRYELTSMEIDVDEEAKFMIISKIKEKFSKDKNAIAIDGIKVRSTNGWFLLRASNTSSKIRLLAEAKTKAGLESLLKEAKAELHAAIGSL